MTEAKWSFLFIILASTLIISIAVKLKMYKTQWPLIFTAPVIPILILVGTVSIIIANFNDKEKNLRAKFTHAFNLLKSTIVGFPILVGITACRVSKIRLKRRKFKRINILAVFSSLKVLYEGFFIETKEKDENLFKYA